MIKKDRIFVAKAYAVIGIVFCLCMWVTCSSCYTEKRGRIQLAKLKTVYPDIYTESCAGDFNPVIYDSTRTEYLPGKTVYQYDTVTVDCDSIIKASEKDPKIVIKTVKIPCPPSINKRDTIVEIREISTENTAKLRHTELKIKDANEKIAKLTTWKWIAFGLIGFSIILLIFIWSLIKRNKKMDGDS